MRSLFSSDRERRLWWWTVAVVVAIYSTLGLTRTLVDELRNSGLLEAAFVSGMVLVAAASAALALKIRPGGVEIGVALGVAATYLLVFVRMALPEERTHLIEYGVVALLVHEALTERAKQGRRIRAPALLALAVTAVLGVIDEGIQAWLPGRVFDPADILVNALAGAMALSASLALARARRQRPSR